MSGRGGHLEQLVAASVKHLEPWGLSIRQTSPRFVGKVLAGGQAIGRLVGHGHLDFVGDYKGRHVAFDAKSCRLKTSFPLKNLKPHQVEQVAEAHSRGALSFFLVEFLDLPGGPRYFALTWPVLEPYWVGRLRVASVPLEVFTRECYEFRLAGSLLDVARGLEEMGREVARA